MTFYKVWYLKDPRSTNFFVSAENTTEARQLVADHLNETANFHTETLFDVGYATKDESDWRTVETKKSNGFGWNFRGSTNAWEEWEACKILGVRKVILEYQP